MSPELDKKLCEKYPKIFVNRNKPMNGTAMCWGFDCGDGWYHIVDAMCEAMQYTFSTSLQVDEVRGKQCNITPYVYNNISQYILPVTCPQVVADQVKEKYGTLRFYFHLEFEERFKELAYGETPLPKATEFANRYSDYIDGIVHMGEVLSSRTCEHTGKRGELHVSGGWVCTLNREFAKTDPFCVSRNYVPVADLPEQKDGTILPISI